MNLCWSTLFWRVFGLATFGGPCLDVAVGVQSRDSSPPDKPIHIVCTFLPVYVHTLNVIGDASGVQVELMINAESGCPHGYALRPTDLKRLARANLLIANGLDMEPFLHELTRVSPAKLITISEECDPIEEPHEHEAEGEHDHAHGAVNGHVWASPKQAALQVTTLGRKLAEADPIRAERYRKNAAAYAMRLTELHERMVKATAGFPVRKIVTSHDAFAYLARDLNLDVVAVLEAEPGQAPSAPTMAALINQIKASGAKCIFFEPGPSERLAKTMARDSGIPAYALNPFNILNREPTAAAYVEVMEENLKVLQIALGSGK